VCTHCPGNDGRFQRATFDVGRCPSPGSLTNDNGKLFCYGLPNQDDIPEGGYKDSCSGCAMRGDLLECSCRAADGGQRTTSYRVKNCKHPGRLDNDNGHLSCKGLQNAKNIPAGGYQRSCNGCQQVQREAGLMLVCSSCRRADGEEVRGVLNLDMCPHPGVPDNRNGHIVCVGVPNDPDVPEGDYQRSCSGCSLVSNGSMLACLGCDKADGSQRAVNFDVSSCPPPKVLDNSDGVLTCRDR